MNLSLRAALLSVALASVLVAGCDDPSKGKAKATSSEAVSATAQAATAAPGATSKYTFDQTSSKITWVGSKVTGKHDGGFDKFSGTIDLVDNAPEKSKVAVDIDTTSITTDTEKLTGHLKSPDFFDVEKNPKATFVTTDIKKGDKPNAYTVTGNLTIKGHAKSISFPATITTGADGVSVDAEFSINRRDYDLNYAGKPNDLIRDDVVLKLAIKSKKSA